MKNLRTSAILIPALLMTLAACGSSTTTSGSAPDPTTTGSTVDTIVDTATVDGSAPIEDATTVPAATTPPTTNPPPTAPPVTNPPPTNPPPTAPQVTTTTVSKTPTFNSFSVSAATPCFPEVPNYPYPDVSVSWDISGATSIYVAIDNVDGPWQQDLAAAGSMMLPPPGCSDQTYYVVAENAFGRTVMQETRGAN